MTDTNDTDEDLYITLDNNYFTENHEYDEMKRYKISHGMNETKPTLLLFIINNILTVDSEIEKEKIIYGNENVIVKEKSEIDKTSAFNYKCLMNISCYKDLIERDEFIPIIINNPVSYVVRNKMKLWKQIKCYFGFFILFIVLTILRL